MVRLKEEDAIIRESAFAVGKPGPGTLRSESHRTLFTLDNSTVKYREDECRRAFRAEAIDFWLPSFVSPPSSVSIGADGLPGRIERDQSGLYRGVTLYRV